MLHYTSVPCAAYESNSPSSQPGSQPYIRIHIPSLLSQPKLLVTSVVSTALLLEIYHTQTQVLQLVLLSHHPMIGTYVRKGRGQLIKSCYFGAPWLAHGL